MHGQTETRSTRLVGVQLLLRAVQDGRLLLVQRGKALLLLLELRGQALLLRRGLQRILWVIIRDLSDERTPDRPGRDACLETTKLHLLGGLQDADDLADLLLRPLDVRLHALARSHTSCS